jgi:hypothetical protein
LGWTIALGSETEPIAPIVSFTLTKRDDEG